MYYDLFLPFPTPDTPVLKKKKDKGKGKAAAPPEDGQSKPSDCWASLSATERAEVARNVALSGHLGYTVVAHTVTAPQSANVIPCPFGTPEERRLPYQSLDPRFAPGSSSEASQPTLVQVTRYHMRLDDGKMHPLTAANTSSLRDYDILSVFVGSDKALQLACTDMSNPGPNQVGVLSIRNSYPVLDMSIVQTHIVQQGIGTVTNDQISIITVPLHERPYHFRLNRKQIRQAQRNGVVFEVLYSAGLFPPHSVSQDVARRYRQNFLTNARELVRVTNGQGIIFSSGPGGSPEGMRGPLDVVNLATILGVPANFAKDAMSGTPKTVLLRTQARRTYKGVLSAPRVVAPPGAAGDEKEPDGDAVMAQVVESPVKNSKRSADVDAATAKKKSKTN